jgi:hypothetical protein
MTDIIYRAFQITPHGIPKPPVIEEEMKRLFSTGVTFPFRERNEFKVYVAIVWKHLWKRVCHRESHTIHKVHIVIDYLTPLVLGNHGRPNRHALWGVLHSIELFIAE